MIQVTLEKNHGSTATARSRGFCDLKIARSVRTYSTAEMTPDRTGATIQLRNIAPTPSSDQLMHLGPMLNIVIPTTPPIEACVEDTGRPR